MTIAVDAMGGDHAPAAIVAGALQAAARWDLRILLVGQKQVVEPLLRRNGSVPSAVEVVDAPEVVHMDEAPAAAVRKKRGSSLSICAELVTQSRADAMFSAGNTGAGMAVGLFKFGRITGVDRPALALPLPNVSGHTILLDAGANVDANAHSLVQYAVMGSIYAAQVLGIPEPRVGLVNIGEEECKGNQLSREALELLKSAPIRFVGNVEGPDLFNGRVDVAVCDGFTGNVILKVGEGVAELVSELLRAETERNPLMKLPAAMLRPALRAVKKRTHYGERGGALLLGINGICLIGHGKSDPAAVANGIRTAGEVARHGIIEKIRAELSD